MAVEISRHIVFNRFSLVGATSQYANLFNHDKIYLSKLFYKIEKIELSFYKNDLEKLIYFYRMKK